MSFPHKKKRFLLKLKIIKKKHTILMLVGTSFYRRKQFRINFKKFMLYRYDI